MLTPTAVSIIILSLCVLLFIRNLLTTYYATPKFEEKINIILNAMSRKLDMIDKIINHNTNRMAIEVSKETMETQNEVERTLFPFTVDCRFRMSLGST